MAKVTKVKITRRIRRGENIIRGIPIPEKTKQRHRFAAQARAAMQKTKLARQKRKAAEKRAKERGR